MMTRRSTISLCMIVKNEERWLARCLAAVRPYVDEICIVDTGSTDGTVAIAERFDAKIKHIAWPGSFAVARNHSLDLARGDWILVLDADEIARPGFEEELALVVDDPRNIGAFVRLTNLGDDDERLHCLVMRLFRNEPEFRFHLAIHEQVVESVVARADAEGRRLIDGVLHLDHYGYTKAVRAEKSKDERDQALFRQALGQEPDCAYLWFKYGDFLRRFEESGPVIAALERACELYERRPPSHQAREPYGVEAHALLALEFVREGKIERAGRILERARQFPLKTAMLHWVGGHQALCADDYHRALGHFDACIALDGVVGHMPCQPGITAEKSQFGRARALLGLGRTEEAIRSFFSGAERYPRSEDFVLAAARVEMSRHDHAAAIRRITAALERDPQRANYWQLGAELLLEAGRFADAGTWIARAVDRMDRHSRANVLATAAEIDLGAGNVEAALDSWMANSTHVTARVGAALIHEAFGEPLPPELIADDAATRVARIALMRRLAQAPYGRIILDRLAAVSTATVDPVRQQSDADLVLDRAQ